MSLGQLVIQTDMEPFYLHFVLYSHSAIRESYETLIRLYCICLQRKNLPHGNLGQLPEGSCWTDRLRSFASSVYPALVLNHTLKIPAKKKVSKSEFHLLPNSEIMPRYKAEVFSVLHSGNKTKTELFIKIPI